MGPTPRPHKKPGHNAPVLWTLLLWSRGAGMPWACKGSRAPTGLAVRLVKAESAYDTLLLPVVVAAGPRPRASGGHSEQPCHCPAPPRKQQHAIPVPQGLEAGPGRAYRGAQGPSQGRRHPRQTCQCHCVQKHPSPRDQGELSKPLTQLRAQELLPSWASHASMDWASEGSTSSVG